MSQPTFRTGIVKSVVSGDTMIIRGPPQGGPPKEWVVGLTNITAPKLARHSADSTQDTKDDSYAWEAREFLRKKLVGKEVYFHSEKAPNSNKEYGTVYIGKDTSGENVSESLVAEGLVDVRRTTSRAQEGHQKLCELEDAAKDSGKGKFGSDQHIRDIKWSVENPRNFMDSFHQQRIPAIVEHVRDGSTVRVVLLPDFYYITLMLSGIRCPLTKQAGQGDEGETYAEEAKFFTECRLLQRDVEVILESVSNQNFFGTVIHPKGNIAELLLSEGFAKCVDWSLRFVSGGPEKLRAAERQAKEKRLRIWKDYVPSGPVIDAKDKEFQGRVVEVVNADALVVKLADGTLKKIFLASIRPPRLSMAADEKQDPKKGKIRPLYDIPYMFEAREFLRKKLIWKKVNVSIDYIQPASNEYPEKVCCTVTIGGINVAEALVSKGLATVIRYRADDDQRSNHYDVLLAAETKAQKSGKGLHSKKETPSRRVVDLSGDLPKSKQFFPFLQRAGRMEAIVEFVSSGSRLRLYVPRENCLLTFLLSGINCPRASRLDLKTSCVINGDPWGDDAMNYTKELCMQREVEIEVEAMDKVGNFIGWLWIDSVNLAVALVQEGLSVVYFTAERSPYYRLLQNAENEAKSKKTKLWESHVSAELEKKEEEKERVWDPSLVEVVEVQSDLTFYAQHHEDGSKLEELLWKLRTEFAQNLPLPGAYVPKRNDICAAMFSQDGLWYRAKIEKISGNDIHILYIDYGNREITTASKLAALPISFLSLPPVARAYCLAFINVPKDPDSVEEARLALKDEVENSSLYLNVEYKVGSTKYVSLVTSDEKKRDIGKILVENGYITVEKRKEKKFQQIIKEYLLLQDAAKALRSNLWRYGDITEDDAKEFG